MVSIDANHHMIRQFVYLLSHEKMYQHKSAMLHLLKLRLFLSFLTVAVSYEHTPTGNALCKGKRGDTYTGDLVAL